VAPPLRVNWILPGLSLAGGIRTVRHLAEGLQARGHDVTVICPSARATWPPPWRIGRMWRRARRAWQLRGAEERHHFQGTRLRLLEVDAERLEARHAPDADAVIGTFWPTMEWIRDWPAAKGIHFYYVQHYETHAGDPERVRATYRQPSTKFVVARWLARLLAEEFGDTDVTLVPNAIDWEQFRVRERSKAEVPVVGTMYSGRRWKRSALAFEAIRRAQLQEPRLRVVAFGDQPLDPADRPPDNLEFHLRPTQAALPELYARCDAWLLASVSEGFGLPGLEAAASRCPVIATRCGGPEDYVEHGRSGFLVDVDDPAQMAQRILEVARMDAGQWAAMSQASHRIAAGFRWETSVETLEALLRSRLRRLKAG
jgi:glycosyltransferase involved in cell wall biosynthesis